MPVIDLSQGDSILNTFVSELRNIEIQHDAWRFRRNLERIGEIMAYELSKQLSYVSKSIQTPMGQHTSGAIDDRLVVATILRAGLPFHQGFLSCFDRAENAFVSAYRKYTDKLHFDIHIEYISSPSIEGKTLILVDPMLATGSSFELAYAALLSRGTPKNVHFASVIAAEAGIAYLRDKFDMDTFHLWCAAIDPDLDHKSYIIPGLGDAGDLAYGVKM
ncbi:MAG: uracil phosphoribosyltransferase [Cyclobacteriaceae bacterium]|nr:uracil phosphoribosyltransferase [Cyclobacteriaceae bacterium]